MPKSHPHRPSFLPLAGLSLCVSRNPAIFLFRSVAHDAQAALLLSAAPHRSLLIPACRVGEHPLSTRSRRLPGESVICGTHLPISGFWSQPTRAPVQPWSSGLPLGRSLGPVWGHVHVHCMCTRQLESALVKQSPGLGRFWTDLSNVL